MVTELGPKIVRARRLAGEWCAENDAPSRVERRLTRALLHRLATHDEIAPSDVETIARELVGELAREGNAACRELAEDWRAGIPSASSQRIAQGGQS